MCRVEASPHFRQTCRVGGLTGRVETYNHTSASRRNLSEPLSKSRGQTLEDEYSEYPAGTDLEWRLLNSVILAAALINQRRNPLRATTSACESCRASPHGGRRVAGSTFAPVPRDTSCMVGARGRVSGANSLTDEDKPGERRPFGRTIIASLRFSMARYGLVGVVHKMDYCVREVVVVSKLIAMVHIS